MYTNDRDKLRQFYFDIWQKIKTSQPLEGLEQQIADVLKDHPEYHAMFENNKVNTEYHAVDGAPNPFMHMGMHLAIRDQVNMNRPAEITLCFQQLCAKFGDAHSAEHQMMDCLSEMLWKAQSSGQAPDENAYMHCLKKMAGITGNK